MAKLQGWKADQIAKDWWRGKWLIKRGSAGGNFWGEETVVQSTDRYMTAYNCQNPKDYTSERVNFNVHKLKKRKQE